MVESLEIDVMIMTLDLFVEAMVELIKTVVMLEELVWKLLTMGSV
jgi:hypothetical protein